MLPRDPQAWSAFWHDQILFDEIRSDGAKSPRLFSLALTARRAVKRRIRRNRHHGMENIMTTQQAAAMHPATMNGLNVQGVFATIDAVKSDTGLAKFQFRAKNRWIDGGENRSTIRDFFGAGREDDS